MNNNQEIRGLDLDSYLGLVHRANMRLPGDEPSVLIGEEEFKLIQSVPQWQLACHVELLNADQLGEFARLGFRAPVTTQVYQLWKDIAWRRAYDSWVREKAKVDAERARGVEFKATAKAILRDARLTLVTNWSFTNEGAEKFLQMMLNEGKDRSECKMFIKILKLESLLGKVSDITSMIN